MKAFHLKTAILAVAISALGYWGCSKDSTTLQATTDNVTTAQKGEIAPNSDEIKAKIDAFDKTLTALQNGENTDFTLTTDDAVWDIEALLNSKYGWGNLRYTTSSRKTIEIPIEDKEIFNAEEIKGLYQQSLQALREHNSSLEKEECRKLVMVDIDIDHSDKGVIFKITSVFGTSTTGELKADSRTAVNFKLHDYLPGCTSSDPKSDVSLTNTINYYYPRPANHGYFVSPVRIQPLTTWLTTGFGESLLLVNGSQKRAYPTYYCQYRDDQKGIVYPGSFDCINQSDQSFYYQNWVQIINNNCPLGKVLSYGEVTQFASLKSITNNTVQTAAHRGGFFYAVSVPSTVPPLNL
jgi:hypothetical protein